MPDVTVDVIEMLRAAAAIHQGNGSFALAAAHRAKAAMLEDTLATMRPAPVLTGRR